MLSVVSVRHSVHGGLGVACDYYPWSHWTSMYRAPCPPYRNLPGSDSCWSKLETCSNLFNWGAPPRADDTWWLLKHVRMVGKRAVHIILDCFLVFLWCMHMCVDVQYILPASVAYLSWTPPVSLRTPPPLGVAPVCWAAVPQAVAPRPPCPGPAPFPAPPAPRWEWPCCPGDPRRPAATDELLPPPLNRDPFRCVPVWSNPSPLARDVTAPWVSITCRRSSYLKHTSVNPFTPIQTECEELLKAGSQLTFTFQDHVKFLPTLRKCRCYVRTLLLVAIDSIHGNANADVKRKQGFTRNWTR